MRTPKTWPEVYQIKVEMQRSVLKSGAKRGRNYTESASLLQMDRQNFVNTCRRLGIDPATGEDRDYG